MYEIYKRYKNPKIKIKQNFNKNITNYYTK